MHNILHELPGAQLFKRWMTCTIGRNHYSMDNSIVFFCLGIFLLAPVFSKGGCHKRVDKSLDYPLAETIVFVSPNPMGSDLSRR